MLKQSFVVVPQGLIKSGTVDYMINEGDGNGSASYDILAGAWILTKTIRGSGSFELKPELLKSANVKPDMVLKAGHVQLTVIKIQGNVATVNMKFDQGDDHVSGVALLDISKEFISIKTATVSGKVFGYDIVLEIQPNV